MTEKIDGRRNPMNTETHKQCPKCKRVLPRESSFHRDIGKHDGLFNWCKECTSAYNKKGVEKKVSRIRERRNKVKKVLVEKMGGACSRCGYDEHLAALDFHHNGENGKKESTIAKLVTRATNQKKEEREKAMIALYAEVEKCILVCSNCHRVLHAGY